MSVPKPWSIFATTFWTPLPSTNIMTTSMMPMTTPMTMTAIAEVLGASPAAVHKRHQRGMVALRECMERSGGAP